MFTHKELEGFQQMFDDANTLTRGTDAAFYWTPLRDALTQSLALEYLRHLNPECLFQAIQTLELGQSKRDWDVVKARLDVLRSGQKLPILPTSWAGSWAMVLQMAFKADWSRADKVRSTYFEAF